MNEGNKAVRDIIEQFVGVVDEAIDALEAGDVGAAIEQLRDAADRWTPEESADDGQPRSPSNGGIYNLELPQWPLRIEAGEPIDEREDIEAIADTLLEPLNVIDARGRSYSVRANGVVLIRSPHDEGTP